MAGLTTDFGASPVTTAFNFLFGPGPALSDSGPNNVNNQNVGGGVMAFDKNIFDDVIGGFDSYFDCKDEFTDLPTPSLTTTDDFLDTILRDLDIVEQQKHENHHNHHESELHQSQQNVQQHHQQQLSPDYAYNDISPHLQQSTKEEDHQITWNKVELLGQPQNAGQSMDSDYFSHADFSQQQHHHQIVDIIDCFKDAHNFFANDVVENKPQSITTSTFVDSTNFVISENNLPPLAETIEVEMTQEHSYAAAVSTTTSTVSAGSSSPASSILSTLLTSSSPCQQHQQSQPCSIFVSQHDSGVSSGAQSPFSSSASMRSSFSSSADTVDHFSVPLYGSGKHQFYSNHNNSRSPSNKAQNRNKSDDVSIDIIEEALKSIKDDDDSDFDRNFGNSPPPITNSFFKPKFKTKSHNHMLPYTKKDIKHEEKYPTLLLSDEEKLLCEKEGVKLPSKFPLTKQEERDLRRIRRKIRNKRSAQESRRKKHEYISSLEDRVRACDDDNQSLRRQVEVLSKSNRSLVEQLKKLQSTVGNGATRPAVQAGTCLAVLLLSFALLVAPNYNLFGKKKFSNGNMSNNAKNGGVGGSNDVSSNRVLVPGNTRTLMQTSNLDEDESGAEDLPTVDGSLLRNVSGGDRSSLHFGVDDYRFGASDHFGAEIKPLDGVVDVGDNVSLETWYVRSGGGGPENGSMGSTSAKIYDKMERMIKYGHMNQNEYETPDPKRKSAAAGVHFWIPSASKRFKSAEIKQELPNFGHIQVANMPVINGADNNKSRQLINNGNALNVGGGGESYYEGIGTKTTSVYINRRQIKVEEF